MLAATGPLASRRSPWNARTLPTRRSRAGRPERRLDARARLGCRDRGRRASGRCSAPTCCSSRAGSTRPRSSSSSCRAGCSARGQRDEGAVVRLRRALPRRGRHSPLRPRHVDARRRNRLQGRGRGACVRSLAARRPRARRRRVLRPLDRDVDLERSTRRATRDAHVPGAVLVSDARPAARVPLAIVPGLRPDRRPEQQPRPARLALEARRLAGREPARPRRRLLHARLPVGDHERGVQRHARRALAEDARAALAVRPQRRRRLEPGLPEHAGRRLPAAVRDHHRRRHPELPDRAAPPRGPGRAHPRRQLHARPAARLRRARTATRRSPTAGCS